MKRALQLSAFCLLLTLFSCKTQESSTTKRKVKLNKTYTTESGLQYMFTELGSDLKAKNGDQVSIHNIGKLADGKEFINSHKTGAPLTFVLGQEKIIKGLDEGIALLNEGDKAVFTIPAALGYGSNEIPELIPANSTLIFDVELVDVIPAGN